MERDPLTDAIAARWTSADAVSTLQAAFSSATPVRHVVLDGFLEPSLARGLVQEFPAIDAMPRSRDYLFGRKHEDPGLGDAGPNAATLREVVLSRPFARWISDVVQEELFVDPTFHGGGFHQGGDGSYLDMHVDFNMHPSQPTWLRRVNILVYLNEDWDPDWDGALILTDDPNVPKTTIAPLFNRCVIMETNERSFHGYAKLELPQGVTRKSVAAYGYSLTAGGIESRTTDWHPVGAGVLKRQLARHWNTLAHAKSRMVDRRHGGR